MTKNYPRLKTLEPEAIADDISACLALCQNQNQNASVQRIYSVSNALEWCADNCKYLQNKNVSNCCLEQSKEMSGEFRQSGRVFRSDWTSDTESTGAVG